MQMQTAIRVQVLHHYLLWTSVFNSLICVKWLCTVFFTYVFYFFFFSLFSSRSLTFNYNSARCLQWLLSLLFLSLSISVFESISTPVDALYFRFNIASGMPVWQLPHRMHIAQTHHMWTVCSWQPISRYLCTQMKLPFLKWQCIKMINS